MKPTEYIKKMNQEGKKIRVELGCGMRKPVDTFGIDIRDYKSVDLVANVGKESMQFPDDSVEEIRSIHLFEHMYPDELFYCIEECWRIPTPSGTLHVEVPLAGTLAYYIHPDHKIQFVQDTFGFFQVPAGGIDPHGYLKVFWHVGIRHNSNPENITAQLHPNKPGGKFEYVEVTRRDNE